MGQSTSRQTPPSPATTSIVSTTTQNDLVSDDSIDDTPPPVPSSSRRSSIRRSILNLVKPKQPNTSNSSSSKQSHPRKSWRTSKRWSKASRMPVSEDVSSSSPPTSRVPPVASLTPAEKHTEIPLPDADTDVGESSHPTIPEEPPHYSPEVAAPFDNAASSADDQVVISPEHFTQDPPDVPEDVLPPPNTDQTTPPLSSSPRQFPPPGTLVVVQGVVHTTDVPRIPGSEPEPDVPESPAMAPRALSSRSSTPASLHSSESAPPARNRLSALLRSRPSSMVSAVDGPSLPSEPAPIDSVENDSPSTDPQPPPGTISSSSIDVLGTLLSVAAAATAASLLTGSSEPILSSGLTPSASVPAQGPAAVPPPPPTDLRPLSPTPTSGITDPMGGRTERMRQAWSSIRERLGIRPPRPSDPNGDRLDPNDARERMLTEMARAFNLGLGINSPDAPAPTEEPPLLPPQLPAEGTFERFLIDLQVDLRATLGHRPEPENEQQHETSSQAPESVAEWGAPSPPAAAVPVDIAETDSFNELPVLDDVSNSDTDSDLSNANLSPSFDASNSPSSSTQTSPLQHSESQRAESPFDHPAPPSDYINWWRLYRFPPVVAPRPGPIDHGRDPSSMFNPSSVPIPENSVSTPAPLPDTPSPPQNTVVPVIVVGLQSVHVNMDWPPVAEQDVTNANASEPPSFPTSTPLDGVPQAPHYQPSRHADAPRGRRWHSRAAHALRNLRPGRRAEAIGQAAEFDPAGSRTFLIYVIGGYYPPDHSIVTSEPNNLDSFEALLDLAEILGQVKPATASKDDIDKSKLEVIKAARVAAYESEGKISSNCVERCLICLDEYAAEDDVRVMGCRHAFHKGCVDTWLLTGKNNCPACRGTGVSTDEPTHTAP